jgi:Ca-activated chloride channel family protein
VYAVASLRALLLLSLLAAGHRVWGEDPVSIVPRARPVSPAQATDLRNGVFRVDSALVVIPVHVTTGLGAPVTDLAKTNFRVLEDSQPQTITLFSNEDAPISIGLLLDASGSMKNKRRKVAEATAAFFKMANRQDEFLLIEFNDGARRILPFTGEFDEVESQVMGSRFFGRTALLDAVHLGLREMKAAHNPRKALVIFSDGGDNWSRRTPRQVDAELLESDVQVYALGIFDDQPAKLRTREEREGPALLEELTGQTGGRIYQVRQADDLPDISARLSRDLRAQYLLGYSPARPARDGKYRHVRVEVLPPPGVQNVRADYRHGYYAPTQ